MKIKNHKKEMHRQFVRAMMGAPPLALKLEFYKDALVKVAEKYALDNPELDDDLIASIKTKIEEEFTWFEGEEGGGYYINMNVPRKMVGDELHKFLRIENNEKEQQKAATLYGTE